MISNKRISIVISFYNLSQYIGGCLLSLEKQSFNNFEIIIVDDGSSRIELDKLREVVKNFKLNILIFSIKNRGLAGARNYGIQKAKGEFIVCLDADDTLAPTYLEETLRTIEKSRVDIVSTYIRLFEGEEYIIKNPKIGLAEELVSNQICGSSLFRRSIWEKVGGYDEDMRNGYEDWDFWIRALAIGAKEEVVAKPLFNYRIRSNSMLQSIEKDWIKKQKLLKYMYSKHCDLYKEHFYDVLMGKEKELIWYKNKLSEHSSALNKSVKDYEDRSKHMNNIRIELETLKREYRDLDYRYNLITDKEKSILHTNAKLISRINRAIDVTKKGLKAIKLDKVARRIYHFSLDLRKNNKKFAKLADVGKWDKGLPLVSIVIPNHNYGQFIKETIESVKKQSWKNLELIIVDDKSDDPHTKQILEELKEDKSLLIYFMPKNLGVVAARNFGISKAKGKYVVCIDADDKIERTYIEKCVWALETNPHAGVAYSYLREFGLRENKWEGGLFSLANLKEWNQVPTNAMFRRICWEEVGGFKDYMKKGHEDWEFWLSIAEQGWEGIRIREELFKYRIHSKESLSNKALEVNEELVNRIKELHFYVYNTGNVENLIKREYDKVLVNEEDINSDQLLRKSRKSILFFAPFIKGGGAERLWADYFEQLKQNGYRIIVVTDLDEEHILLDKYRDNIVGVFNLPKFLPREYWDYFVINQINKYSVSVVIISNSRYGYQLLPKLRSTFPKINLMDIVYNDSIYGCKDLSIKYKKDLNVHLVNNNIIPKDYIRAGITKNRIEFLPSPVDLNIFNRDFYKNEDLRLKYHINEKDFVITYLGRFSGEKNVELLIEGFAKLYNSNKELLLLLIGGGELQQTYEEKIKALKLDGAVRIMSFIDNPAEMYIVSDLIVLISSIEGNPLTVLEALAMNSPILLSKEANTIDLIEDGKNGYLLDSLNINSLVSKLEGITKGKMRLKEINLRKFVQKFSKEKVAAKLQSIIEKSDRDI